jgi:hypothetical protein
MRRVVLALVIVAAAAAAPSCGRPDFAFDELAPKPTDAAAPRDSSVHADADTDAAADTAAPPVDSGPLDVAACARKICAYPNLYFWDDGQGTIHCYLRDTTDSPWNVAMCAGAFPGTHLVTITTSAERGAVLNLFQSFTGKYWIGLSTEKPGGSTLQSDFKWVTGEVSPTIDDWADQRPNDFGRAVYFDMSGVIGKQWYDDSFTTPHNFLCEREVPLTSCR